MSEVPKVWENGRVACLASGPSFLPEQAEACRAAGFGLVACNEQHAFKPDVLYAPDLAWLNENDAKIADGPILLTANEPFAKAHPRWQHINWRDEPGMSLDRAMVHTGSNAGFTLVNLAMLMGAQTILLIGYDMRQVNGASHWFGEHPPHIDQGRSKDGNKYIKWHAKFQKAVPDIERAGVTVINCTPDSALPCFPMMPLTEALATL